MARHLLGTAAAVMPRHPGEAHRVFEEELDMKPIVMSMSLVIAGMILPGVALGSERRNHQDEECSVATLFGEYLFTGRADAPAYTHSRLAQRFRRGVYLRWRRQDVWSVQPEPRW